MELFVTIFSYQVFFVVCVIMLIMTIIIVCVCVYVCFFVCTTVRILVNRSKGKKTLFKPVDNRLKSVKYAMFIVWTCACACMDRIFSIFYWAFVVVSFMLLLILFFYRVFFFSLAFLNSFDEMAASRNYTQKHFVVLNVHTFMFNVLDFALSTLCLNISMLNEKHEKHFVS